MESPAANASLVRPGKVLLAVGFVSAAVGLAAAAFLSWGPYNRAVVQKQPVAQTVRVDSAHLAKSGFVAIYLNEPPGSRVVGVSTYLPAGSYRNILVPYEYAEVLPDWMQPEDQIKESRLMFVRLFADDGDQVFEETSDKPVKTLFGSLYTRNFAVTYDRQNRAVNAFLADPTQFIWDLLIP